MIPESQLGKVVPYNLRRIFIPPEILARLEQFLVDKRTGNVRFNIRDGVILGAHVEEIVAVKGRSGR